MVRVAVGVDTAVLDTVLGVSGIMISLEEVYRQNRPLYLVPFHVIVAIS
jgi:hypothetical protein